MKKVLLPALFTFLSISIAQAETVRISCHPMPYKNSATITATVVVSNIPTEPGYVLGQASYEATLKALTTGSVESRASGQLSGRVASAELKDAKGEPQILKTFWASGTEGDALRIQLAIGANTGIAANSYIQSKDGTYYFAKCNVDSVE